MKQSWWKLLAVVLLYYVFTAGFLMKVPQIGNLQQTIRNFFFHVPMWFGQMIILLISLIYSILYLRSGNLLHDIRAKEFARTGTLLGFLGLITGAVWANFTWGAPWNNDPKQVAAAISLLIYMAYFVLRGSVTDLDQRARISSIYNIFAYFIYIPLIMILPRMVESLHPGGQGAEGNPALSGKDLDPSMRIVFWPAVAGWTLLSIWITQLSIRFQSIQEKKWLHA
jgi:heme exporter protein C